MKSETRARLNDPRLLQVREAHFARLEDLFANRFLSQAFVLQGIVGQSDVDAYADPEGWVDAALDDLAGRADAALDSKVFRPLVLECNPYVVHFVDRMFGLHVYMNERHWWSECLLTSMGALRPPDLDKDDTWRLAQRIAKAFLDLEVTVPLFGLPTIASPLNILVNLYGEAALAAMIEQPPVVHHDLRVINDLLCGLHHWYREHIPAAQLQPVVAAGRCQPRGFGQICGCTTHLLSAGMYRDYIAALDDELLSVYDHGGMIHLCGVHRQHIPVWREMRSLRAVQLNDRAAEDLETYFHELRDDQVIYLNSTATMTVERGMEITDGRRLVIVADVKDPPVRAR